MTNENRLNPEKGRVFQEQVHKALEKYYGVKFLLNCPMPIGVPPKPHKFDLVSINKEYVVECKNIVWTKGGNRPSAKWHSVMKRYSIYPFCQVMCARF